MKKPWVITGQAFALVAVSVLTMAGVRAARTQDVPGLQVVAEAPTLAFVDGELTVTMTAAGPDPITTVELWVDGELEQTEQTTAALIGHEIAWTPDTKGWSSIEVKVIDAQGNTASSPPVAVNLLEPAGQPHVVGGPESESVDEVASALGITPAELLTGNPGLDPGRVFGPGSLVYPPMAPAPIPNFGDPSVSINDGVLSVAGANGIFLYLTQDGVSRRVPDDPSKLLRTTRGRVLLGPHLPPLDDGDVEVEVWARRDGVELLAELVLPAHEFATPVTDLHALLELPFMESIPVKHLKATDEDVVEFVWSANQPYDGVAWFIASTNPGSNGKLQPNGVLQFGQAQGNGGKFTIDLSLNTPPKVSPQAASAGGVVEVLAPFTTTSTTTPTPLELGSLKGLLDSLGSTWVWVVPIDAEGSWAGPPSDVVELEVLPAPYDPADNPPFDVVSVNLELPPAPNPGLANCVRVVSEHPPFPVAVGFSFYLNPDGTTQRKGYGAATVTGTLPYPMGADGRAIYPFTACPGEEGNFQWGDTSCGLNPLCHLSKAGESLSEAAIAFGEFLGDLAGKAVEAYNELKAWAVKQVTDTLCPDAVAGPCATLIEIGVDVLLTTVGVPPTLPEFDDLAAAAKGELVDVALDQLGVGSACDAVATAGTGKTCGELASQLDDLDACTFAPKGQEENCRQLVASAELICQEAINAAQCTTLSNSARDLVEKGYGVVIDESIDAISSQVTNASLESIGFPTQWWPWGGGDPGHGCWWGGPPAYNIVCPPTTKLMAGFGQTPQGCHLGNFGQDDGKTVCALPPADIDVVPEPRGEFRPIVVKVILKRNDNPMPEDFACGPLTAQVTTLNQQGASGQPYLPATKSFPGGGGILGTGLHVVHLVLSEPNTSILIPAEKKPPNPLEDLFGDIAGDFLGASTPTSDWKHLLSAGSLAGVKVSGDCIQEAQGGGDFGVAGIIPDALPRISPGEAG